jgi:hypothetical protein
MIASCTAFEGTNCIATGDVKHVALRAKAAVDSGSLAPLLIFDDDTSELVELDFRGTPADVLQRLEQSEAPRRPGRPKLGVVAREVTLLPRHWDWLNGQPGGASVAIRKLVDETRRMHAGRDKVRVAREVTYRFLSAMAGNEPGFEEATRALFAGNRQRFEEMAGQWPVDVARHAGKLAAAAFETSEEGVE